MIHWNVPSAGHIGWEGTKELIAIGEKVCRVGRAEPFDEYGNRINYKEDEYTKSVSPYVARINYDKNIQNFPEMLNYLLSGNRKDFPSTYRKGIAS